VTAIRIIHDWASKRTLDPHPRLDGKFSDRASIIVTEIDEIAGSSLPVRTGSHRYILSQASDRTWNAM